MIKLSLCMIVKVEETVLERCLESAAGKNNRQENPTDEIIIADTGSTDGTKKIAEAYGAKIYDFPWKNDFSAARNFAFSKATGDYILWLDADDYISDEARKKLFALKKRLSDTGAPAAFCRYEIAAYSSPAAPTVTAFYRTRIVKNDGSAVWKGRVHECLPRYENALTEPENGFCVRHLGSEKPRGTRNLDIYRAQISEKEPLSPRDLFYYGRELFYHGFYTEADAIEEKFIARPDGWYVNKIEARKIQSACREATGDEAGAADALFSTFSYGAPRAGVLCALGRIFKRKIDFSSAYFWYLSAYNAKDHSAEGDFENPDERGAIPLIEAVYCAYSAGEKAEARKLHEECMRLYPDRPAVKYNCAFFDTHPD